MHKVALVTGSAKRVGRCTVEHLHRLGWNLAIHCAHSKIEAEALAQSLNAQRADSAMVIVADLCDANTYARIVAEASQKWQRLDALINNASSFYPTPIAEASLKDWDHLFASNARAPFFLAQAAAPHLQKTEGVIINMVDIHTDHPVKDYAIYTMAKAALVGMTYSLARDLAPHVRVNAVAPGMVLWPDEGLPETVKTDIVKKILLKRPGEPRHIAQAIQFLLEHDYITGEILKVDGGRSLNI